MKFRDGKRKLIFYFYFLDKGERVLDKISITYLAYL